MRPQVGDVAGPRTHRNRARRAGRDRVPSRARPARGPGGDRAQRAGRSSASRTGRDRRLGQKLDRVRRADHHERPARGLVRDRDLQVRAERLERADDADDTLVARERLRVRAAAEEVLSACLRRRGVAAWKPTENPPASNPRCSRTKRIPPTMDCASARLAPWSGRLDTSRRSGRPPPPDCTSWQTECGRAASRDGGEAVVTQTSSAPASTSRGDVSEAMRFASLVRGSMRWISSVISFVAHTAPSP